jgi:hypothetical protein
MKVISTLIFLFSFYAGSASAVGVYTDGKSTVSMTVDKGIEQYISWTAQIPNELDKDFLLVCMQMERNKNAQLTVEASYIFCENMLQNF